MRKLLTGLEAMIALATGEKVEGLIGGQYALIAADSCVAIANFLNPEFAEEMQFRLVPDTIMIGDIEVPSPSKKDLVIGAQYFAPLLTHPSLYAAFTWRDIELNHFHLKQGLIQLTPENAIEHAHALIFISGGTPSEAPALSTLDNLMLEKSEERKRRRRTKAEIEAERAKDTEPTESIAIQPAHENEAGSIDIRADLSLENMPLSEIAATFHVTEPVPVENDEILTQSDLPTEESETETGYPTKTLINQIFDEIAKAKTGTEVLIILDCWSNDPYITSEELLQINDAAGKRNAELAGWPKVNPNEVPALEQKSLAVRFKECATREQLRELSPEIEFLNIQIQESMWEVFNECFNKLSA